ncbi:MAG: hypothetical protein ACJ8AW_29765, partial [Rhodopila sp.]
MVFRSSVSIRASDWSAGVGPAIAPPLTAGVDENAVCRMRVSGHHRAIRTHRTRLPQVPLPHVRQAIQRAVRHVLNRAQYPSDVIALVVLWRLRYKLSLRDLPEMFAIRGIVFSHEAVREW